MHFLQNRKSKGPTINITSLIDVMFLLVIFVLITARFDPQGGIAVDLAKGKSKEVPKEAIYELTIMHDGTMFLNKDKVANLQALEKGIQAYRGKVKDPVLVIKADKAVEWQRIVLVTDTAKQAGQGKVNFRIKQ